MALASLLSHGLATASPSSTVATSGLRTFQLAPLPAVARAAFAEMVQGVGTETNRAAIARRLARRSRALPGALDSVIDGAIEGASAEGHAAAAQGAEH